MTHLTRTRFAAMWLGTMSLGAPMIALTQSPAAPAAASPVALSAATRDSVIDGTLAALDRGYVFPEKARAMREAIEARRAAGEYAGITGASALAEALTRDLQAVSHDKHLRVRHGSGPQGPGGPVRRDRAAFEAAGRASNFGVGKAEVLPGNVGYVEIQSFGYPPELSAEAVAAAMTTVADADALIVDIRRNGGGAPQAVALVSSYLFGEEPVHLNSLYWRPGDRTDDFYTLRTVAGKRFGPDKPVYVLTSSRTFSAAEEFAYNLQTRKRATIVGETTGGGAHPGQVQRVLGDFTVFVPTGRAINPITKTNWEGTGVRPDIAVPADSALARAIAAARARS